MVITDLNQPNVNYFAVCGKWLDKEQDDGLISRDLEVYTDLAEVRKGSYRFRKTCLFFFR